MNIDGFITADDGVKLHYAENKVARPAAEFLVVHGMGDHLGRYGHVVEHLNAAFVNVTRFDHRGHGLSQGSRVFCADFRRIVDDVEMMVDHIRGTDATRPLFIYGHSMGALAVSLWACRHPGEATGLILASGMTTLGFRYAELLPLPGPAERYIEFDAKKPQTDAVAVDPLLELGVTAGLMNAIHLGAGWLSCNYDKIVDPVLVLQGGKDLWVPESESRMYYECIASECKRLTVYPGMRHNLLHEAGCDNVLEDMTRWLEKRIDAQLSGIPSEGARAV